MKALFQAIEAKIKAELTDVKFVNPWNNQVNQVEDGSIYSFPMPAIFIDFGMPDEIKQLGNGVQIHDPLIVEIHIVQEFYHDGENMERNLDIFDLRTDVYKALQKFEPSGAVQFIRFEEEHDKEHTDVYHYIQKYRTNYIDQSRTEPVNGINSTPPTDLSITIDSVESI
jgi:hypothetical protein